ncbi:MAG: AGE family epimerase/isomerase [Oscillospiraceae bacterium]
MKRKLKTMEQQLLEELPRILAYWEKTSWDGEKGIFLTLGCDNRPLKSGRRSAVLVSRVLWAFSAAYRLTGERHYLEVAGLAYEDLMKNFLDRQFGGLYVGLEADGTPYSDNKSTYTQSYAIYGLSEYYLAGGGEESLNKAKDIFRRIEEHAYSNEFGGYTAVCGRDWSDLGGGLEVDTYLHLTESYANLLKAWDDEELRASLRRVVSILTEKFLRPDGGLYQGLNRDWSCTQDVSDRFADDAEGAWMILEAASAIGDAVFTGTVNAAAEKMITRLATVGYDAQNGGVFDRLNSDGTMSTDKMWWEESESAIAMLYGFRLNGSEELAQKALETWDFIRRFICTENNEWNWKVHADGTFVPITDPSKPLKCPYHSTRIVTHCVPIINTI